MLSITSLALALVAAMSSSAPPPAEAPVRAHALERDVIAFSILGAETETVQVVGREGDVVLWQHVLASVEKRSDHEAGAMWVGETVYACPEGAQYGDEACEYRSWTNRSGYGMTVTADASLNTLSVVGSLDVYDPQTWEVVGKDEVDLTFTGVGSRSKVLHDNGKGWQRTSLATGSVGDTSWDSLSSRISAVRYRFHI